MNVDLEPYIYRTRSSSDGSATQVCRESVAVITAVIMVVIVLVVVLIVVAVVVGGVVGATAAIV
jgi:hypothetical protein